jgi:hypothetical protein
MLNSIPTRTQKVTKQAGIICATIIIIMGLLMSHKYAYDKGIVAGVEAYHAQCLVGGYLIDDQGQAVICGPLGKAPQEEKQTYKDKVNAPTLF